jgi:signal transduction histidine kinase
MEIQPTKISLNELVMKTVEVAEPVAKKAGTGLGLGIVKKIVEAHGGDVSFQSNLGKGVTFSVRFPFLEVRR